jgi:hypothetical protein
MASIGGDTNTLLRKFMDRSRRKPGRVRTGTPVPNGKKATFRPGKGAGYKPGKQG